MRLLISKFYFLKYKKKAEQLLPFCYSINFPEVGLVGVVWDCPPFHHRYRRWL